MTTTTYHRRVGLTGWSLHPKTPAQLVEGLTNLGLQTVQLMLNQWVEQPDVWADGKARFDDAGITLASGTFGTLNEDYSTLESIRLTGGVILDETWQNNWQLVQKIAPLAQSLGLDKVSTHAGFLPDDPSDPAYDKLIERLGNIADLFASHGLALLFETGQETAHTLEAFLQALARPNVAVNFDPANMILYDKGDPIESLKTLLPRIQQVHIKDATRAETPGTWGLEVPAGDGEVDWTTFVNLLEDGHFDGCYIIEREAGTERNTDVTQAAEMITQQLNR